MPLQHRRVDSASTFANPAVFETCNDAERLQGSTFASTMGAVSQITILTSFAHEIFEGLAREILCTNTTIQNLSLRTKNLNERISLKAGLHQKDETVSSESAADELSGIHVERIHSSGLISETMPLRLQDKYVRIREVPSFTAFKELMGEKQRLTTGEIAKHFSNPALFFEKWYAEQEKRMVEIKEERAAKKAERRARRSSIALEHARAAGSVSKLKRRISWQER